MSRKRSRPSTEQKFKDAVLELVAQRGCGALGINAVAQIAGADKVLIYRYFGDFDGLLETVANSRNWVPNPEDIFDALPTGATDPMSILGSVEQALINFIRSDDCLLQVLRWRRAEDSPIERKFNAQWSALWTEIPARLSAKLDSPQRLLWRQLCSLLSLVIEAELCGDTIDRSSLKHIVEKIEDIEIERSHTLITVEADTLPTNLL